MHTFIHSFIYSFMLVLSFHLFVRSIIYLLYYSFMHLLNPSCITVFADQLWKLSIHIMRYQVCSSGLLGFISLFQIVSATLPTDGTISLSFYTLCHIAIYHLLQIVSFRCLATYHIIYRYMLLTINRVISLPYYTSCHIVWFIVSLFVVPMLRTDSCRVVICRSYASYRLVPCHFLS